MSPFKNVQISIVALFTCIFMQWSESSFSQSRPPRFRAIIVGISNYVGDLKLKSPVSPGAKQMQVAMEKYARRAGYSPENIEVRMFVDDPAVGSHGGKYFREISTGQILTWMTDAALETSNAKDTLVFFFTGHGSRENKLMYLYASNAREGDNANYLDLAKVLERFEDKSKAGTKLLFIDACQIITDGGGAFGPVGSPPYGTLEQLQSMRTQGVAMFFASSKAKPAHIDPALGYGYFTAVLASALSGDGGGASVSPTGIRYAAQLDSYLSASVREVVAEKAKATQEPMAVLAGAANYDLMPLIASPSTLGSSLSGSAERNEGARNVIRVNRAVFPGEKISLSVVREARGADKEIMVAEDFPIRFEDHLKGGCFARTLEKDAIISWFDVDVCS